MRSAVDQEIRDLIQKNGRITFAQFRQAFLYSPRWVEEMGYDGIDTNEDFPSPFLALTLAAEHTSKVSLSTSTALSPASMNGIESSDAPKKGSLV